MDMPECPYKQDSEYRSSPNYAKIMNTEKF